MTLLRIKDLEVWYDLYQAIFGVSLEIHEGESVGLLGSNGAGKTTTLRAVAGALPVSSGWVEFRGCRVENKPTHELAAMGMIQVPEGRELYPSLTVLENLELGCVTREARRRLSDSLHFVLDLFPTLRERSRQTAGTLSGGEQQMLAIGRALMGLPKLLMLDEPSLGLAPLVVEMMFATLEKINAQGTTVIVVEQHIHHVLRICQRGYVLERGRVVHEGSSAVLQADDRLRTSYLGI